MPVSALDHVFLWRTLSRWGLGCWRTSSMPVLGGCLSPHLGFASWRSLNYFAVSRHLWHFLGALFAECVLGVRLSGHRSPATPCTAAIRRHCLSGMYSFFPYLVAVLRLQCRFTAFVAFFRGTLCRVHLGVPQLFVDIVFVLLVFSGAYAVEGFFCEPEE